MIFINFFYIHSITWKILLCDIKSFHKNIAKILQNFQTLFQKRKKMETRPTFYTWKTPTKFRLDPLTPSKVIVST